MISEGDSTDSVPAIPDDSIPWDEVEGAARAIFSVWAYGREFEWAKECWRHFQAAGLATYEGEFETTVAYLRLVTLGRVYREFCAVMWDEDTTDYPLTDLAEELSINPVALGILAAREVEQDFDGAEDEHQLRERSLSSAITILRPEVFACLLEAYGGDLQLYSRMAATQNSQDGESEERDQEENLFDSSIFQPTGRNASALSYVSNGFRYD